MTPKNATEVCQLVENDLGWLPPVTETKPRWKVIAIEAGKLKRKIATNPALFTWENLELTVAMLRREKKSVKSPTAICWHVERALREAAERFAETPLDERIRQACVLEMVDGDPDGWVSKFGRAVGPVRAGLYAEWEETRRG